MSSRQLLKGTLILTCAGIITRILGFFYRIYLSNIIGAVNLGIYQLVFPVYGICHTIYVSGIQTSLSKKVAELNNKNTPNTAVNYLVHALILSVIPASLLLIVVYAGSDFIANRFLFEPRSAICLRYMAPIFPVCAVTACINGYYYGLKSTKIPAISQLIEQTSRIVSILFLTISGILNSTSGCLIAVIGLIAGELFSCLFNITSVIRCETIKINLMRTYFLHILTPATALTANRLLVNILGSIESTLIPVMLKRYGLNCEQSLALYGTLTGMSLPFIMFPSTIAGSFSVMLLPEVSQANAIGDKTHIKKITTDVISISVIVGACATSLFLLFGNELGILVFSSKEAGYFISVLSWICPFLYLSITFSSILNGLGKTTLVLINSMIGLAIRIVLLITLIPIHGLTGYLYALLVSQILITIMDIVAIKICVNPTMNIAIKVLFPFISAFVITFPLKKLYILLINILNINSRIYSLCILFFICLICCGIYFSIYARNFKFNKRKLTK